MAGANVEGIEVEGAEVPRTAVREACARETEASGAMVESRDAAEPGSVRSHGTSRLSVRFVARRRQSTLGWAQ
ncbi:hypothetical protein CEY04_18050 [Achromobacter sp. HZ28]|nr:hypothetical protein CEY04_18050 [Achromobacter sp. HZ28]OWT76145.1 hypothetical protein CEY05_13500 [Achromobacter sp. HZ34]